MDIQVETTRLADGSREIRALKAELLDTMEQIECLVLSMNGAWQGDAERAYAGKILYVKEQFTHIADFFEEYARVLHDFAYAYEQQETAISSQINLA